ncbi:hypothetical protein [Cupriavidus necator]
MFTPQQIWCVAEEHALVAQTSFPVIATMRMRAFRAAGSSSARTGDFEKFLVPEMYQAHPLPI